MCYNEPTSCALLGDAVGVKSAADVVALVSDAEGTPFAERRRGWLRSLFCRRPPLARSNALQRTFDTWLGFMP